MKESEIHAICISKPSFKHYLIIECAIGILYFGTSLYRLKWCCSLGQHFLNSEAPLFKETLLYS